MPVARYYTPEEFAELRELGLAMGFSHVESSPLTRSSYHAWEQATPRRPSHGRSGASPRAANGSTPRWSALVAESTAAAAQGEDPKAGSRPGRRVPRTGSVRCCSSAASRRRRGEAYSLGKIGGFCHLYIGQEAVAVGSARRAAAGRLHHLRPTAITARRSRAASRRAAVMAELFGKATGCSRRQGRLDAPLRRARSNFLGGHGIVGGHIPLATGVGFAIKYRGGDQVAVCFFGEAAVNNGAFHEALNMAALWKLPVVYHQREQPLRHGHRARARVARSTTSTSAPPLRHGARGRRRAGRVRRARSAWRGGRARARASKLPTLLEVRTYRFMGHSMSDAVSGTYRTRRSSRSSMKRDPIALLRSSMQEDGG